MDKKHEDLDTIDLEAPRLAQSMEETLKCGVLGGHHPCSEERIEVLSNTVERYHSSRNCEGGVDVIGVVTPLGGVAQAFHGDQVVELRVQLAVQEVEGTEEDREGQVEVEEENRLKEVRSWMTMEMK